MESLYGSLPYRHVIHQMQCMDFRLASDLLSRWHEQNHSIFEVKVRVKVEICGFILA